MAEESADTDRFQDQKFVSPVREILDEVDMPKWLKSQAYSELMGFILSVNNALKGKKCNVDCVVSETTQKLLNLLDKLSENVDTTPCIEQPQRFGNKAFAQWHEKLKNEADTLVAETLPKNLEKAVIEVKDYLINAFGNEVRIDYGTGHELAFAAFLCCYFKLMVLTADDQVAIGVKVFEKYLTLVRKIQKTYRMEAAGSHGVWGLDDFQFLPFLWGSSQFFMNPTFFPKDFVDPDVVKRNYQDYMFLGAIKYIQDTKTGLFAEHSNVLWNISGVPGWGKVNSGMIKMYKAEVLGKFPVVQHFRFGNIFSIEPK